MSDHLLLRVKGEDALATWRWRVGADSEVVALSLSGDIFFRDGSGQIFWLDTGAGTVEHIASTEQTFWQVLADPARAKELLLQPVVESFLQDGSFPIGKCLGYKVLPVFGGAYSGDNRVMFTAAEHFAVTGNVHEQIKDLPDGGSVEFTIVE